MGAEISKQYDQLKEGLEVPPFRATGPRYDMDTFVGRMLHFYSVNDPLTLLTTKEEVRTAEKLLRLKEKGEAPAGTTDAELWSARRVQEASLHPDTREPIFPLFRFSAFVPMNMIIVTATVTPAVMSSFPATAFIHFFNQTYNAAINYANRNASNPVPLPRLAEGYVGAVATSLTIGLTATALTKRVQARGGGGPAASIIRSTLPFLAVAGAGASNVFLMRRNELETGVNVFDDDGKDLGKSVKVGVSECNRHRDTDGSCRHTFKRTHGPCPETHLGCSEAPRHTNPIKQLVPFSGEMFRVAHRRPSPAVTQWSYYAQRFPSYTTSSVSACSR